MSVIIRRDIDNDETLPENCMFIPYILHGHKNVFIKKRYLNSRKDYQSFSVIPTSCGKVNSFTVSYSCNGVLRRFYTGIPIFVPADLSDSDVREFRDYLALLNEDIISFLSTRVEELSDPEDPLGLYIIPELINNGAKANYIIAKKFNPVQGDSPCIGRGLLEVLCIANRRKPDYIDIIFRNYARFHQGIEESIEKALHCHWTERMKLKKERIHRFNSESSEYGLPSIKNALKKYYCGELIYDGYDDSFSDFGAYQFTMRLPVSSGR